MPFVRLKTHTTIAPAVASAPSSTKILRGSTMSSTPHTIWIDGDREERSSRASGDDRAWSIIARTWSSPAANEQIAMM